MATIVIQELAQRVALSPTTNPVGTIPSVGTGLMKDSSATTLTYIPVTYLTAITGAELDAVFTGASGLLKKTGAATYTLDTATYQPLASNLTTIAGITPVRGGLIVANATPQYAALALGGASGSILTRNATDPGWSAYYLAGTAGQTYTFPSTTASIVGGSGTQYYVPLWGSGGAVLGNSLIQQDASATAVIIGDNLNSRKFNVRYNPGGTSAAGMDFGHSGTGGATLGILATATGHGWGGGKIVFYDDVNSHALQVLDCNSGNIWIGGTSAATAPVLYVNGNGQVSIGGAPTSTHAFDIYKTGTAVYMAVGDLSSTGPLFYVGSDGTNAYLMSRNNQPLAFGANNTSTQLIIGTSGQLTASYYSTGILHSSAAGLISSSLIVATDVTTNTLTYACLQQVSATSRVLGRITAGAGNIEELTAANLKTICGYYTSGDNPSFAGLTISGFSTAAGVLQNSAAGVISSSLISADDVTNNTLTNTQLDNLGTENAVPLFDTTGLVVSMLSQDTYCSTLAIGYNTVAGAPYPIGNLMTRFFPASGYDALFNLAGVGESFRVHSDLSVLMAAGNWLEFGELNHYIRNKNNSTDLAHSDLEIGNSHGNTVFLSGGGCWVASESLRVGNILIGGYQQGYGIQAPMVWDTDLSSVVKTDAYGQLVRSSNLSRVYTFRRRRSLIDVYGTYPLYLGANSCVCKSIACIE